MDFTTGADESPLGAPPDAAADPYWVRGRSRRPRAGRRTGSSAQPASSLPFATMPATVEYLAAARSGRRRVAAAAAVAALGAVAFVSVANANSHAPNSAANAGGRSGADSAVLPSRAGGAGMFSPGSQAGLGATDQGAGLGRPTTPATDNRTHPGRPRRGGGSPRRLPGDGEHQHPRAGGVGAGTGIVLTDTGEVLTNNHVVDGARSIVATDLGNGRIYRALVVGTDRTPRHRGAAVDRRQRPAHRLALRHPGKGRRRRHRGRQRRGRRHPELGPGHGDRTQPRDHRDRRERPKPGAGHRHDPVDDRHSPGDSGGPLVDLTGQVVGMDTAGAFASGHTTGPAETAFSIPIAQALSIANQLAATANGQGGLLGLPI